MNISVAKLIGDFIAFAILALLVLFYKTAIDPAFVGFYCDDLSIRYPFVPSTISRTALIVLTFILPAILIVAIEAIEVLIWERNLQIQSDYLHKHIRIHRFFTRIYIILGYFLMGIFINQLFIDIAKFTIGSLRPNFIAICKPNLSAERCNSSEPIFITHYECTNENTEDVTDARLSFYSGHAAFSFYAAVYLFFYLRARLNREPLTRAALPVAQCILFMIAFYVSYTRIRDYKHHLRDVIVGIIMGSIVAYFVMLRVGAIFEGHLLVEKRQNDDVEADLRSMNASINSKAAKTSITSSAPATPPTATDMSSSSFLSAVDVPSNNRHSPILNNIKRSILVY